MSKISFGEDMITSFINKAKYSILLMILSFVLPLRGMKRWQEINQKMRLGNGHFIDIYTECSCREIPSLFGEDMDKHIENYHQERKGNFLCPFGGCGKRFTHYSNKKAPIDNFKLHMLVHTHEKVFKCCKCNRNFARKSSRTQHYPKCLTGITTKRVPDNFKLQQDEFFKCRKCDRNFVGKCWLAKHFQTCSAKRGNLELPRTNIEYSKCACVYDLEKEDNQQYFREHVNIKHKIDDNHYSCPFISCWQNVDSFDLFKRHIADHMASANVKLAWFASSDDDLSDLSSSSQEENPETSHNQGFPKDSEVESESKSGQEQGDGVELGSFWQD